MGLKETLTNDVNGILSVAWDLRDGQVVPTSDTVNLSNGGVRIEAAYLYADMADSTTLARDFDRRTAARVVRGYLKVMSRCIREYGGQIRSFDGDRVMGIFVGESKRSNVAKCCLKMNYAFTEILRPAVVAKYPILSANGYVLEHTAGADVGDVLIVRGGVVNSNDLVSIGKPPNVAAKLSDVREPPFRSFITRAVYSRLNEDSKYSDGTDMWESRTLTIKGESQLVYRSSYYWGMH